MITPSIPSVIHRLAENPKECQYLDFNHKKNLFESTSHLIRQQWQLNWELTCKYMFYWQMKCKCKMQVIFLQLGDVKHAGVSPESVGLVQSNASQSLSILKPWEITILSSLGSALTWPLYHHFLSLRKRWFSQDLSELTRKYKPQMKSLN